MQKLNSTAFYYKYENSLKTIKARQGKQTVLLNQLKINQKKKNLEKLGVSTRIPSRNNCFKRKEASIT